MVAKRIVVPKLEAKPERSELISASNANVKAVPNFQCKIIYVHVTRNWKLDFTGLPVGTQFSDDSLSTSVLYIAFIEFELPEIEKRSRSLRYFTNNTPWPVFFSCSGFKY